MRVHVVLGRAKSNITNSFPAHQEHAFIAFAAVESDERAVEAAIAHMEVVGWYDVICQKVGLVNVEMLAGLEAEAREAYEDAVNGKVNAIVYADPIA